MKPSAEGRRRTIDLVVSGTMSERMRQSFPDLDVTTVEEGTRLRGPVADEAALHGLLERCQALHLELVSVTMSPETAPDHAD